MHRVGFTVASVFAIAAVFFGGQALGGETSKGSKVALARGSFAHHTWSFAVRGQHHHDCYILWLAGDGVAGGGATCEPDRQRQPLFRPLTSSSDDKATVEVVATRNRVRSMRLRIGHPRSSRPAEWIRVRNKRMTRRQAHKSGVARDFRFAVLHSRGNLCVKQFVLFNSDGDRIEKQRVPCEF